MFRAIRTFITKRRAAKLQALRAARADCIAKIANGRFPQVAAHELRALTTAQLRLEVAGLSSQRQRAAMGSGSR